MINLLFITYNRLFYTKLALESILADKSEEFSLTIWDNASSDETPDYLTSIDDPRIKDIVLSKENVGQIEATNRIWSESKADLLGKLDNDCIVTPGWTKTLSQAHEDIPELGVIAMWHFFEDDFDYTRAEHKIQEFNGHNIFRHPWTCGTGLLIKREVYQKLGPMPGPTTNSYWLEMAKAGYINGFYYPFICQEHMDDPKSKYCEIQDEASFAKAQATTVGLQSGNYKDIAGRYKWRDEIVRNLLDDPYDIKYYIGWRKKWQNVKKKVNNLIP